MSTKIIIGVSFSETKYPNYPKWILGDRPDIELIELSWEKQNLADLHKCQGLLLTGGIDIDPIFYQSIKTDYPNQPLKWNEARDQFEIDLLISAFTIKMPVLGICRGLQLINIALGGTLIADIEAAGKPNHRAQNGVDHYHNVALVEGSLIENICSTKTGTVNSAHHQSIETIAVSFMLNAISSDGIVEGIEWKDKVHKSPLIAVQWHPERLEKNNPLSTNLREWFLTEASKYSL
ncbi:MAG: gamma-glutamyl-gamma-aminobutyrate hydrolase family protein [Chitinophagaceae bacterium]|nr:gamma-glutamyl-gamma-aminobutyrate hydrolase family protein [Chitinophagaceae bacterium]